MELTLTSREHELLLQMIDERIREIKPEIRRSRTSTFHDELKKELEELKALQAKLQQSSYDVKA